MSNFKIYVVSLCSLGFILFPGIAFADLKATKVAYGWHEGSNPQQFKNANNDAIWDGRWVSFLHELSFDNDELTYNSQTTKWHGTMEFAQYYKDTTGEYGFTETRNWKLVDCDRDNDIDFDNKDLKVNPQTTVTEYTGGTLSVIAQDIITPCSTGNCDKEIVTSIYINTDSDFDGTQNNDIPSAGLCFYAEAKTAETGPTAQAWGGNVQVRITAGGGDKTVNYRPTTGTPVILSSFDTYNYFNQTVVEWKTSSEVRTAGFHLLRLNEERRNFIRINENLIPSLTLSAQGGTYRIIDTTANIGETYSYKLLEVRTNGRTKKHGPFTVNAGLKTAEFNLSNENLQRIPHKISFKKKQRINKAKNNKKSGLTKRKKRKGTEIKLTVTDSGLYFISADEIGKQLNLTTKKIRNFIRKRKLAVRNQGNKVSFLPAEKNLGIFFYGEKLESNYSDSNIYWITIGKKESGSLMGSTNSKVSKQVNRNSVFVDSIHFEEDRYGVPGYFADPNADIWIWDYIVSGHPSMGNKTLNFKLKDISDQGTAELSMQLQGGTDTILGDDHHVFVTVNGIQVGETKWGGIKAHSTQFIFNQNILMNGENTVGVTGVLDDGVDFSILSIDSFDVTYNRYYQADNNRLFFTSQIKSAATVKGFSDKDIFVFNVTDPITPSLINKTKIVKNKNGKHQISFSVLPNNKYLTLTLDAVMAADSYICDKTSKLKSKKNGADYIIISPTEFLEGAQTLANYRHSFGYQVKVVELEDIMDEFNHGIYSPVALQKFLSHAYNNWRTPPRYVVLLGEGTYDYKDIRGLSENFVPPMLVSTLFGIFSSDNSYADVNKDGIPEMAIGRIPVVSIDELNHFLDKLIYYETINAGDWAEKIIMLSDNADDGGDFTFDSDNLAALLPLSYDIEKIYLSNFSVYDARLAFQNAFANGALLVNYIGHGGPTRLATEGLILNSDRLIASTGNGIPVMTAMTCLINRFALPGFDAIGEKLLLDRDGGFIGVWGPTGMSLNNDAVTLDKYFFNLVFNNDEKIIGDAVRKSLSQYVSKGGLQWMANIYTLLGDPAMRLK